MTIIEVLNKAEAIYISEVTRGKYVGMCYCIKVAASHDGGRSYPSYSSILDNIPEFNPFSLHGTKIPTTPGLDFWWDVESVDSRVDAFEALKTIYTGSKKEFIY